MSVLLPREAPPFAALAAPRPRSALPGSLSAEWPQVEIVDVDVRPDPNDPARRIRVKACLRLGALLPVDVTVDLIPVNGRPPGCRCRMFSVQSLSGCAYLFEGTPVVDEIGPHGFEIRVSPAVRSGAAPTPAPVVRRVAFAH